MGRKAKNQSSRKGASTSSSKGKKTASVENQIEDTPSPTACCICHGFDDEDLIILCDGKDCTKETHMYCLQPPLFEVPDGEWYCDTCDPLGTTKYLEKYFKQNEEIVSLFPRPLSSEHYQLYMMSLRQNLLTTDTSINLDLSEEFIVSEFEVSNSSKITQSMSSYFPFGHHFSKKSRASPSNNWIGCKLKLFCPVDQREHVGRIIDVGHEEERKCDQFLVQFKSGIDGRNSPYLAWIVLHEHACIVYSDVIWYNDRNHGWWPAQYAFRSGLYLMKYSIPPVDPLTQQYIELFNSDAMKIIALDDENSFLFRDHDPKGFKRTKAFILAYVQAESEEEEKLSAIRAHSLLPKDVLRRKGALVDGLKAKSLQLLSEYANQLIEILGEDEDEERELSFPDILTVRGTIAVLSDTVQYESLASDGEKFLSSALRKGKTSTERETSDDDEERIEEMNEIIPMDLVYIASELEPSVPLDRKIFLCNRRVVKHNDAEDSLSVRYLQEANEEGKMETNSNDGESKGDALRDISSSWQVGTFNVGEWIADQSTKILQAEEARRIAEIEARKEERKKLLAIAREEREQKKKEAAEKRRLKYLEKKQKEIEEREKRMKEEAEEEKNESQSRLEYEEIKKYLSSSEDSNPDAPVTRRRRNDKIKKKEQKKKKQTKTKRDAVSSSSSENEEEQKTSEAVAPVVYPTIPLNETDRSTWKGKIVRHIISKEVGKIISFDDQRVEIQTTWGDMKGKDIHFELLHPSSHEFLSFECANILLEDSSSSSTNEKKVSLDPSGSEADNDLTLPEDESVTLLASEELMNDGPIDYSISAPVEANGPTLPSSEEKEGSEKSPPSTVRAGPKSRPAKIKFINFVMNQRAAGVTSASIIDDERRKLISTSTFRTLISSSKSFEPSPSSQATYNTSVRKDLSHVQGKFPERARERGFIPKFEKDYPRKPLHRQNSSDSTNFHHRDEKEDRHLMSDRPVDRVHDSNQRIEEKEWRGRTEKRSRSFDRNDSYRRGDYHSSRDNRYPDQRNMAFEQPQPHISVKDPPNRDYEPQRYSRFQSERKSYDKETPDSRKSLTSDNLPPSFSPTKGDKLAKDDRNKYEKVAVVDRPPIKAENKDQIISQPSILPEKHTVTPIPINQAQSLTKARPTDPRSRSTANVDERATSDIQKKPEAEDDDIQQLFNQLKGKPSTANDHLAPLLVPPVVPPTPLVPPPPPPATLNLPPKNVLEPPLEGTNVPTAVKKRRFGPKVELAANNENFCQQEFVHHDPSPHADLTNSYAPVPFQTSPTSIGHIPSKSRPSRFEKLPEASYSNSYPDPYPAANFQQQEWEAPRVLPYDRSGPLSEPSYPATPQTDGFTHEPWTEPHALYSESTATNSSSSSSRRRSRFSQPEPNYPPQVESLDYPSSQYPHDYDQMNYHQGPPANSYHDSFSEPSYHTAPVEHSYEHYEPPAFSAPPPLEQPHIFPDPHQDPHFGDMNYSSEAPPSQAKQKSFTKKSQKWLRPFRSTSSYPLEAARDFVATEDIFAQSVTYPLEGPSSNLEYYNPHDTAYHSYDGEVKYGGYQDQYPPYDVQMPPLERQSHYDSSQHPYPIHSDPSYALNQDQPYPYPNPPEQYDPYYPPHPDHAFPTHQEPHFMDPSVHVPPTSLNSGPPSKSKFISRQVTQLPNQQANEKKRPREISEETKNFIAPNPSTNTTTVKNSQTPKPKAQPPPPLHGPKKLKNLPANSAASYLDQLRNVSTPSETHSSNKSTAQPPNPAFPLTSPVSTVPHTSFESHSNFPSKTPATKNTYHPSQQPSLPSYPPRSHQKTTPAPPQHPLTAVQTNQKREKQMSPNETEDKNEKSIHDIHREMEELGNQLKVVQEEIANTKRPLEDMEDGEVSE